MVRLSYHVTAVAAVLSWSSSVAAKAVPHGRRNPQGMNPSMTMGSGSGMGMGGGMYGGMGGGMYGGMGGGMGMGMGAATSAMAAAGTSSVVAPGLQTTATLCGETGVNTNLPVPNARAIYFQTNKNPNAVVAMKVMNNGSLAPGSQTTSFTGGLGGNVIDTKTNKPAVGDALSSQGSVEVVGNYLFAVNAGSNSVSMFAINPADPAQLTMIGQPAQTPGEFPTSVAPSLGLGMVCAACSGAKAGVTCAPFDGNTGIGTFDNLRPFNLGQVTPPTGPLNGVGDCFFTDDNSMLVTTVKGDPTKNNTGFVSTIPAGMLHKGMVSREDVHTSPPGTAVLFGTAQVPGTSMLLATDASVGAVMLDLNNLGATPQSMVNVTDQAATCWAKTSPAFNNVGFVTDVGVNHIVPINLATGQQMGEFNSTNGNAGMIDFVAANKMMYALSPGNQTNGAGAKIAVFMMMNNGTIMDVQNVDAKGADGNAQGMAVLTQ